MRKRIVVTVLRVEAVQKNLKTIGLAIKCYGGESKLESGYQKQGGAGTGTTGRNWDPNRT